jgi:hypothetical protein
MLIAGAFLLGSVAVGIGLTFITWDQALVDFFGVLGGIAFLAFMIHNTRSITLPKVDSASLERPAPEEAVEPS